MKKILLVLVATLISVSAYSQGTTTPFNNCAITGISAGFGSTDTIGTVGLNCGGTIFEGRIPVIMGYQYVTSPYRTSLQDNAGQNAGLNVFNILMLAYNKNYKVAVSTADKAYDGGPSAPGGQKYLVGVKYCRSTSSCAW